ncbi:sulfotransferase family protein [Murinocardiopsis flavida]|uniref:Sulfotransferase family protein n=1 Tax=Murinocardiopsis flavida TaxID=645275 RepID=A0A2P8DSR8_9ACTN|nr:sulfotransferase [Murinocardiopsis flavida]PSL00263.1 sulfotransferase family protein [Murinocardiopsis flavida]
MKQSPYILVVNGAKVRRPVFVLGAPHSGVGLLAHALSRSPGFHLTTGHEGVLRAVYAVARRPSVAEGKATGAASLLRDAFAEAWHLTPHTCPRCGAGPRSARESAGPCPHAGEVEHYGDASPDLLYSAAALDTAFDNAAFVQIIRDGRDVVADMLDDEQTLAWFRPGMANLDQELPNPFFGIEDEDERRAYRTMSMAAKCALRWRSAVRLSARLRGTLGADRLKTLRYEDVCGDEVRAAEELREFTGARVSAVELMRTESPGIGSWRSRLSAEQGDDVLASARPELERLGYLRPA